MADDRRQQARPPSRGRTVTSQGEIITAVEVEQRIAKVADEIENMVTVIATKARESAESEARYKVRFAQERLKARDMEGHGPGGRTSNDEADDRATSACKDELQHHLITEALYFAAVHALKARTSQMDALRTIAANIRHAT